ncbi:MAG: hypothetical protein SVX43_08890 [Cyanobacteriota bacterium]|nr:hypothetical protein [Cyanobacteriota bacterium]
MLSRKKLLAVLLGIAIALSLLNPRITLAQSSTTLKISGTPWGVSTRYIGACEGNVNFDPQDLQDLGMNTYRIYGGMARWEAEDDDGEYGWPSIAEIKANPDSIDWEWWDRIMTNPPNGSDYWQSGSPNEVWQGNARTLFGTLKEAGIRPVLNLRNVDTLWNPSWALQLNPPRTPEDWNEWWEHVFATVYWLNVRNDYQVDEFEIHNEPEHRDQGWGGSQADYFELVKVAGDAIDYVYRTYLPERTYHIHAPVSVGGSRWPLAALQNIPNHFDSVSIHDYASDISEYVGLVHRWMNDYGHADSPLWLGEWGTYQTGYDDLQFSLSLIENAIRGSQPDSYVYGSHIFSLYDWGVDGGHGLVGARGERRMGYYALRMAIRVLQGGRTTFATSTPNPDLMAIATRDENNNIDLLVVNHGETSYTVNTELEELANLGTGTVWEFSASVKDEIVGQLPLDRGRTQFAIPARAAMAIEFQGEETVDRQR